MTESMVEESQEICQECKQPNISHKWCKDCNSKHFQKQFSSWTSNNITIDKFIQDIQLKAVNKYQVLEWVPYEKFSDVKYLARGGYGEVFKAKWKDGCIQCWDCASQKWERKINKPDGLEVVLKSLYDSKDITSEFLEEINYQITSVSLRDYIVQCYGITKDLNTDNFMMVMGYASNGSLRNYLNQSFTDLTWGEKLYILYTAAEGLVGIHDANLIHKDFHGGNIVINGRMSLVTDFGLCKPVNRNSKRKSKQHVYGVLPYIAPEILCGEKYTQATDIYSFGMVMYEVATGFPPFYNIPHDESLVIKIYQGFRPEIDVSNTPKLINDLILRCWHANPKCRPTAKEVKDILKIWLEEYNDYLLYNKQEYSELWKQIVAIEQSQSIGQFSNNQIKNTPSIRLNYTTHPQAVYTSRPINVSEFSLIVSGSIK